MVRLEDSGAADLVLPLLQMALTPGGGECSCWPHTILAIKNEAHVPLHVMVPVA
jgi:hypothetical protein